MCWAPASTTALDESWSARAEYLYTNLGLAGFAFASAPARYDTQYDLHRFRIGLNYHFGEAEDDRKTKEDDRGPGSWEVHGQAAFVFQGYPPIAAPYDGTNSLPAGGQSRETSTCRPPSACGCGRAASSTTIPSCCRATASR